LKADPNIFVLNLDKLTYAGKVEHIEPPYENYKFFQGDICDAEYISDVLKMEAPDVIIHLAAETHVDNSFGNSFTFTHTNVYGTHVLLECVRKHVDTPEGKNFKVFLHMSTDEVYGSVDDNESPRRENALFAPSNPYAATKAAAEMICHAYVKSFHLPIIITRCNNAISKYQNDEKLVPRVIHCIHKGIKVPVHGEGKSKRTFIHAYDIAAALIMVVDKGTVGETYNIGTDQEYSVLEVVKMLLEIMTPAESGSVEDHIVLQPDRPFQDYRYSIDTSALKALGWSPEFSFAESLSYVIAHKNKQLRPI
jgi:dTDP-glucose 4,6-dehydratase